jgi:NAD(P)-dependent dehydrogenase (short-subunit alcohol dehydrogenase family)
MQASHARNLMFWQKRSPPPTGQVVAITGAGSGIGLHVALVYAARASKLILMDRDAAALAKAQQRCEAEGATGVQVMCLTVDVTDYPSVQAAFDKALERFHRLDVLVLCAGLGGHHLFDATTDLAIFKKLMDVNFYGSEERQPASTG